MDIGDAKVIAEGLIAQWLDGTWSITFEHRHAWWRFMSWLRCLRGTTDFCCQQICLDPHWVRHWNTTPEDVADTVRHEIAHVLAGRKEGHGQAWRDQMDVVAASCPHFL